MLCFVVLASFLELLPHATGQERYFVATPSTIYPGVDHNIFVSVYNVGQDRIPVTISVELENGFLLNEPLVISVGNGAVSRGVIRVPLSVISEKAVTPQYVVVRVRSSHSQLSFDQRKRVVLSLQTLKVFIQTDKPIYVRDDKVNIRIVVVNSLLKPSDTSKAIIEIKNPDNVVADRFELKKFSKSTITRRTIDLGPRPIEGQWTIRATYGINEALSSEYHFEVRDYVLPRFDVTIVPPLHVTSNDENINVTVKAKYTYGKGVQGLLTLRLGVLEDDASNVTEFLNRQYTISADENGVKKISLQNRGYGIFPLNKRLWIYASVVERASGIKQTAKNTFVTFSSSRYRIQCDPVNRHYHPDLPVQGTVRVSHQAGHPAEEVGLEFTMSGTTQQRVTNSKGDAFYNFPAISSSSRLTINVRVLTEMVSVSCQLEPFSSPCPSTSSILIVSPSHLQEDFVEIKATDANFKILKHPANTRRVKY
jgi:hypothetical protein